MWRSAPVLMSNTSIWNLSMSWFKHKEKCLSCSLLASASSIQQCFQTLQLKMSMSYQTITEWCLIVSESISSLKVNKNAYTLLIYNHKGRQEKLYHEIPFPISTVIHVSLDNISLFPVALICHLQTASWITSTWNIYGLPVNMRTVPKWILWIKVVWHT